MLETAVVASTSWEIVIFKTCKQGTYFVLIWVLSLACSAVYAQSTSIISAPVKMGERLSDWLLRNVGPNADTTALHWQVWAEQAPQARLKQAVLSNVSPFPELQQWLQRLPVTGRLNVAIADARWLQGTPAQDPVLQDGQSVVIYPRPQTVTLLSQTGLPCTVTHQAGVGISDYMRACWGSDALAGVDVAWVAQSDGRTRRFGMAMWNMHAQDEPGPGAWIWAPERRAQVAESTSDNLIRFLATQPPFHAVIGTKTLAPEGAWLGSFKTVEKRQPTASDWGEIGLLQTPTARMLPAGDARLHISRVAPYTRSTVMLQPMDWLEGGFRYTDISNRLYGPAIAGNQSYKDKSLDFKIRLAEEGRWMPQLALGVRDLGGTGLFSSEYLVASKRWGEFDASLGLAWGYLGGRRDVRNPLSVLGAKFNTRPAVDTGLGGVPSLSTMFRGPAAVFGGVQWQPSGSPWTLKFELDGNNYQHEPQGNNQQASWPVNLGASYAYSPNIDIGMGFERGKTWMLGLTFHGGLNKLYSPKLMDPALPAVQVTAFRLEAAPTMVKTVEAYTGWRVHGIAHSGSVSTLVADTDGATYLKDRIERAITVLNRDAPSSTKKFILVLEERGLALTRVEVVRDEWILQHTAPVPPTLKLKSIEASAWPQGATTNNELGYLAKGSSMDWGTSYSQVLGGPNGFILYQMGVQSSVEHQFTPNTWLTANFNLRLLDNYGSFVFDGPSNLPRVRTDMRQYALASRLTMPALQLTHLTQISQNQYVSLYGGMLESMFGGVGGEWLYRPWRSPLAFGVDVNHVRKRGYSQDFSFKDYKVNTGHVSMYWDTGWNDVQVTLSAGQYLAGDKGATLDIKRVFSNGAMIGAWATKTNVSAEQFGEGSFDKGIYASIPIDAILPKSMPGFANMSWRPLTRDGGARLGRKYNLIHLTGQRDLRALKWRENKPSGLTSAQDNSYILSEPSRNIFESLGSAGANLGQQAANIPASTWLWAGGAVLASSFLDKPVDDWAKTHQTPRWNRLGSVGNKLPVMMALGSGVLYTGIAGGGASSTAQTALTAGAYTLGASVLTRYAVGRSRPIDNQGQTSFDGFNKDALQSGFPSNHVALAFALATPYAQKNDAPWVYGLAGLTALGRIQSRDHWVSDTVAGGLLGYAIGTMVGQQSRSAKDMRLSVTHNTLVAQWLID